MNNSDYFTKDFPMFFKTEAVKVSVLFVALFSIFWGNAGAVGFPVFSIVAAFFSLLCLSRFRWKAISHKHLLFSSLLVFYALALYRHYSLSALYEFVGACMVFSVMFFASMSLKNEPILEAYRLALVSAAVLAASFGLFRFADVLCSCFPWFGSEYFVSIPKGSSINDDYNMYALLLLLALSAIVFEKLVVINKLVTFGVVILILAALVNSGSRRGIVLLVVLLSHIWIFRKEYSLLISKSIVQKNRLVLLSLLLLLVFSGGFVRYVDSAVVRADVGEFIQQPAVHLQRGVAKGGMVTLENSVGGTAVISEHQVNVQEPEKVLLNASGDRSVLVADDMAGIVVVRGDDIFRKDVFEHLSGFENEPHPLNHQSQLSRVSEYIQRHRILSLAGYEAVAPRINRLLASYEIYSSYTVSEKLFGAGFEYLTIMGGISGLSEDNPHNVFVSSLLYSGILGLLTLLFFCFLFYRACYSPIGRLHPNFYIVMVFWLTSSNSIFSVKLLVFVSLLFLFLVSLDLVEREYLEQV